MPNLKRLLSGNEAIALGAHHGGVAVAAAYPGTPSTEIIESLAQLEGPYVEWSTNEKVALEVAIGACYGGVRALAVMKHVGLNVAADPYFAVATTGVNGGLVIVSCDDPGVHSSQGEQDNRYYAKFAKIPMLEPTDSDDAYHLLPWAFEISEKFDTPVMLRATTRISHCKSVVNVDGARPQEIRKTGFQHNPQKYVMIPANARPRRRIMEQRLAELREYVEDFPLNRMEIKNRKLGVITSGIAYQYAREVFPDASFLKLVSTFPVPEKMIRRFAAEVERVIVIEELEPFLQEQVSALGIKVTGKEFIPICGELNLDIVAAGAADAGLIKKKETVATQQKAIKLPPRPPLLCAGCPHRGVEYALRHLNLPQSAEAKEKNGAFSSGGLIVTGDIGCYTLGVLPPLRTLDTTACMGASIGQAIGLSKTDVDEKVVAVIGDSTFMHSGITGLVDMVYNQAKTTVVILDNGTTAMTGHQGNPATGVSVRKEKVGKVDLAALVKGAGISNVSVVDAFNFKDIKETLIRTVNSGEPAVVIVRGDCPLNVRASGKKFVVDKDACVNCQICLQVGCPAITVVDNKIVINDLCIGSACTICTQVCPSHAIVPE